MPDHMIREAANSILKALNIARWDPQGIQYIGLYRLTRDYTNEKGRLGVLKASAGERCELLKSTGDWAKVRFVDEGSPLSTREVGYVPWSHLEEVPPEPEPEPEPELKTKLQPEPEPEPQIEAEVEPELQSQPPLARAQSRRKDQHSGQCCACSR